jgi:hypothetical protein
MTDTERRSDPLEDTDWTEWYSDHRAWPVSRHVFLADAALRLGRVMFKPWEDRLLSLAGRSLVPLPRGLRWVGPERTPFQGGFQLDVDDIDIEAGLSRPSNWTDEEEEQLFEADGENNLREAARESARAIAVGLAKLAARGSIKTYARTISGGRLEEVQPADWEIDDPVSRLASCRLTPGDPGSPAWAGTHLIFVESEADEEAGRLRTREPDRAEQRRSASRRQGSGGWRKQARRPGNAMRDGNEKLSCQEASEMDQGNPKGSGREIDRSTLLRWGS